MGRRSAVHDLPIAKLGSSIQCPCRTGPIKSPREIARQAQICQVGRRSASLGRLKGQYSRWNGEQEEEATQNLSVAQSSAFARLLASTCSEHQVSCQGCTGLSLSGVFLEYCRRSVGVFRAATERCYPTFVGVFRVADQAVKRKDWNLRKASSTHQSTVPANSTSTLLPPCLAGAGAAPSADVVLRALATKTFGLWRAGATLATSA